MLKKEAVLTKENKRKGKGEPPQEEEIKKESGDGLREALGRAFEKAHQSTGIGGVKFRVLGSGINSL
ncbi:hypothetical protein KJ603_00075 [Patescibacteria group bacterium]|nr:hypothetical protein [Patescibacteria group bacterium]